MKLTIGRRKFSQHDHVIHKTYGVGRVLCGGTHPIVQFIDIGAIRVNGKNLRLTTYSVMNRNRKAIRDSIKRNISRFREFLKGF